MPPLASSEHDEVNIALLAQWIGSAALINRQTYEEWRLAQSLPATSEGDPTSDADFDGSTNEAEFIAGTAPLDGASFFETAASGAPGPTVTITLEVPANRSAQVETSTDLQMWILWDVPGNQGLATPGGTLMLSGPRIGPAQFFRARVKGN
jgi:hypothetical protein